MKRVSSAVVVLGTVLLGVVVLIAVSEPRQEMQSSLEEASAPTNEPSPALPAAAVGEPTLAPPRPNPDEAENAPAEGVVCASIEVEIVGPPAP